MKRWLNILTGLALTFIIIVGIWKSKPETLKNQPFLLDGSNGVSIAYSTIGKNPKKKCKLGKPHCFAYLKS